MAIHEFSLATLMELDNARVVEAWNQAVQRCASDCEDRPALKKPRKVTLELELIPVFEQDGAVLDSINASFKVKDSAPQREGKTYSLGVRRTRDKRHQLVFNDLSDENVNQRTIDQE